MGVKLDPSALAIYTERAWLSQKGPVTAAKATSVPSGDQLAEPPGTKAEVVPRGVSLVKLLPFDQTTNRSCGALSLVSFLASGWKNRSLEPSGEDAMG
jgi:hypothetical protein